MDSAGWYTTLETQYRLSYPNRKNNVFKSLDSSQLDLRLSAACLKGKDFSITGRLTYDNSSEGFRGAQGDSSFGIGEISKYMTDIKILQQPPQSKIDYLLDFRFLKGVGKVIGQPETNISELPNAFRTFIPKGAVRVQHYPFGLRDASNFYAAIPKSLGDLKEEGFNQAVFDNAALGKEAVRFYNMSFTDEIIDKFQLTGNSAAGNATKLFDATGPTAGREKSTDLYYYFPPNVYIKPGKRYQMMISQGSFAILDPTPYWKYYNDGNNPNFQQDARDEFNKVKTFFQLNFGQTKTYQSIPETGFITYNDQFNDYHNASEDFNNQ